jgi:hypothetical protein
MILKKYLKARPILVVTAMLIFSVLVINLISSPQASAVVAGDPSGSPSTSTGANIDDGTAECKSVYSKNRTAALACIVGYQGYLDLKPQAETCDSLGNGSSVIGSKSECGKGYSLALTDDKNSQGSTSKPGVTHAAPISTHDVCGDENSDNAVRTSINIGCQGRGNPILDMLFAFIRFLTTGVGLVLIASLIYGGIQYSLSRGDPQSTKIALTRIRSVIGALLLFVFAYAILNYLIPGQVLK